MAISAFSLHRWWQSFGFGIQSKNDYAFLHDVLREKYPYYAYDDLKKAFPAAKHSEHRTAQLLFRICNSQHDTTIHLVGTYSTLEKEAVRIAAKSNIIFTDRLLHLHGIKVLIVKDINNTNAELWQRVTEAPTITYDMVDTGLAFFNKNRYPEHYSIRKL